jgi:electron-transferring-flavoprotein dehydrogenase
VEEKKYNQTNVLIVGAGPAGLACAIRLKHKNPHLDVCVIEKGLDLGNNNLSGAVLELESLKNLLDAACPGWEKTDDAKKILEQKIVADDFVFLTKKRSFGISPFIKLAKLLHLGTGQLIHQGDYSVSISMLTKWLGQIAKQMGVEVLCGFAASDILCDELQGNVNAVKLVDQGLDKDGNRQPNFVEGEKINADFFVLAEGNDGLISEKFIEKAGLKRRQQQLYSVGVKELYKVTPEQFKKFGSGRVVHSLGYPLWQPLIGPDMFGGGIIYAGNDDHISVGVIVGADWKYHNFNPQDALTLFKEHPFVKQLIEGGVVVEAGVKMIPEGGFCAIPKDPQTGSIGKNNCLILGDSAGFVNMLKIKGLHNAVNSGILAADAIVTNLDKPKLAARGYTELVNKSNIYKEMLSACTFRQTVAKFGPTFGIPLSVLGNLLPKFTVEKDYEAMTTASYDLKLPIDFDKNTFIALAGTHHREDQPSHLKIIDKEICRLKCTPKFKSPCITFCPAGVYETVSGEVKPANPSNCIHCKTCQRKCPFDNIRWTVPEGGGGPRYKRL